MFGGNQLTQFKEIGKCGAVVESAGGVDGGARSTRHHLAFSVPGVFMFLTAPFAGGIEILQAKANRIDLAMATGALDLLHVCGEFFSLGEGLAVQAQSCGTFAGAGGGGECSK